MTNTEIVQQLVLHTDAAFFYYLPYFIFSLILVGAMYVVSSMRTILS